MNEQPSVSFVVASRNDNHGGDMLKRMRLFVNGLIHQCNKFKLRAELIMVEWNPPAGSPLLQEVLPKPATNDYLTLRYIVVPHEVHTRYQMSSRIPLFQMTAKNVGIRRAKSDFILCTNIDLLFSDALMQWLAEKQLEEGKYYRANRCDIPKDISEEWSVEEQLAYAQRNILARHGHNARYMNLYHLKPWVYKFYFLAPILNPLVAPIRSRINPLGFRLSKIDYEACGDFTLMHKNDWLKIEGYAELDLYSIHIDSMALSAANALGIQQVVLPRAQCTYHIWHEAGWTSMDAKTILHFMLQRPGIDWQVMQNASQEILKNGTNYGINSPDWGFANETFDEYTFN